MKKKKRLSGIERRWFVNNVGVIMLLVLACVLGVVLYMAAYYDTNLRSGLENRAKTTTDFFSNYIGQSYNEYYQSCIKFAKTFEDKDRLELQFISPGGKIVASSYGKFAGRSPSTPEIQQAIDSQQTRHYKGRNPLTGERILAVSSPMIYTNGEVIGVLRYVTSLRNADLQVLMIALIAVTVGLLFIGSIFFLSSFFIRSILVPVSQINATAKRIAAGSYGVQIPGQYDDEIGELVSTTNDMSVKIGQAEKTQTEFISSVSHELRTPMTTISGFAEGLLDGTIPPEDEKKYLRAISDETKRLSRLVRDMLDVSQLRNRAADPTKRIDFDLTELTLQTLLSFESRATKKNLDVDPQLPDNHIMVHADKDAITQVIYNLLDNAVKFASPGSCITVRIYKDNGKAYVSVRDYGETIPPDDLPFIFDRFHKSDRSRSLDKDGVGLGLYLVKSIINSHDEDIAVTSRDGMTEFVFTLALAKNEVGEKKTNLF